MLSNKWHLRPVLLALLSAVAAMAFNVASLPAVSNGSDPPHLEITKSVTPDPVSIGEAATVTLTITGAGEPATTRVPLDVILIIDRSISMNSNNKLNDAKAAAVAFVDTLDPSQDRVGVVAYGSTSTLVQGLTDDFTLVKSQTVTVE